MEASKRSSKGSPLGLRWLEARGSISLSSKAHPLRLSKSGLGNPFRNNEPEYSPREAKKKSVRRSASSSLALNPQIVEWQSCFEGALPGGIDSW